MSNIIDSIQVSGTTYTIQDENATKTLELTQAQYDALAVKDPNTFYIITDAAAGDLTNYYTKSETSGATQISTALNAKADTATTYTKTEVDNAITAATSTKQDTLVSGTNIKTINNESILGSGNIDIQGGGGSTYQAGRGIDITNNTISFNLPISAGTGTNSLLMNEGSTASGKKSIAGGQSCSATIEGGIALGQLTAVNNRGNWGVALGNLTTVSQRYAMAVNSSNQANGEASFVCGSNNIVNNKSEHASGQYNNSVSASTTFGNSGNTLFSVGNGTSSARHNAFEIRQNGDIYCSDGTNDVKLQDTITATAANTTALGGLKLVKLTQQEYDALTTKDSNTLYVIV